MVDVHRYHEISEATHRIMNPMSFDTIMLLGDICRLRPGMRLLDLACGKGELLCQFARAHGVSGVGVDIHPPVLAAAAARAEALGVTDEVELIGGDASKPLTLGSFEVVSCVGAPWIGGGLAGTLDVLDAAGVDLVEMVLANESEWDRYAASQWLNVSDWLLAHPDDPEAPAVRAERDHARRQYLAENGTPSDGARVRGAPPALRREAAAGACHRLPPSTAPPDTAPPGTSPAPMMLSGSGTGW